MRDIASKEILPTTCKQHHNQQVNPPPTHISPDEGWWEGEAVEGEERMWRKTSNEGKNNMRELHSWQS